MDNVIKYVDKKYNFVEMFNSKTGTYIRSGILKDNKDTGIDPFMRSFPALIDIGVMGHCIHGKTGLCLKSGVQCYQNGLNSTKPNMTLDNFKKIIDEASQKGMFQTALGGCGDVDQHENFEELLKYCRDKNIVPNFTSSGLGFTKEIVDICKKYCGAVAISEYRNDYTKNAINMLLEAGITTNIHYVLGNNTIDEAIYRLENLDFPKGINAIIFLLHKPIGLGKKDNVLNVNDERVKKFFSLIDTKKFPFQIGFDSCCVPGILNFTKNISLNSIDTCEAGRFSMYITADMKALPCSFDNQDEKWAYDISNDTIQNAWDSIIFDDFRSHFHNSCKSCTKRNNCYGGCPICNDIVLCNNSNKE
jgi:radical SAM protein with 4Fe4S-binding SPASM domain